MSVTPMICDTCRWWDRLDGDKQNGQCRRMPPRSEDMLEMLIDGDCSPTETVWIYFPLVTWEDWCGEWTEKP